MTFHPMFLQRQPVAAIRSTYESECQQCGVCCVYHCASPFNIPAPNLDVPRPFVQIGPKQNSGNNRFIRIARLKDKAFTGDRQYMKCAALEGWPRQSVLCSIYEHRPSACRDYDPGSPACVAARRWAGLEMPDDFLGHS